MKKLLLSLVLGIGAVANIQAAGLITTNLAAAGTNVLAVGPVQAYEVTVGSTVANVVRLYDATNVQLTNILPSYVGASNVPSKTVTWLQTNASFVYTTNGVTFTQHLIQTNISLAGSYTTNYTVPQTTNNLAPAVMLFVPAGQTATLSAVDLNFVNGITMATTNAATVIIYTRD
jgi:hypothetical protein